MIELKNLVKRYGSQLAVDNLNLTIEDGKIYGFLGANGAGKSTTMNMITGYLSATEGEIVVNGHDVLEEPEEAKACIGYLPEMPPLYPDMTVNEYLVFCAGLKNIPADERDSQIKQVIEMTRIEDVSGRLIRNLSKGYKQRVGLAQAILGFPPIIILDEPTVGLDPKQIIEIRSLIRELGKEHTVILSSHILTEVQEVCDQIIIISHGKLMANDTTENLEKHLHSSDELSIEIKADVDTVKDLFATLDDINILAIKENGDTTSVSVEFSQDNDIRENIFYACANAKAPIIEMSIKATSLEDVFLELTSDTNKDNKDNKDN